MLTAPRLPYWRKRFETFMDETVLVPFEWGQADCGPAFIGGLVLALTGEDVAQRWRDRYRSRAGALRVLRNSGFGNLGDLVAAELPEIHPSRATIGDVMAIKSDDAFGHALGICNGASVFVRRPDGLGLVDLLACERAFRVGGEP